MEVKVYCPCGSKYKFDVEPVNGRMPWPVNCPTCGADGTAQANEIIAQTLAANPVASAPVPVAAPVAAAPAPAPAPGGLRINKPAPAPPMAAQPPVAGPPRFTPATARPPVPRASSESMWAKIGGGIFGFLVVGLFTLRWVLRIWRVSHAFSGSGISDSQLAAALNEAKEMNLMADNGVVLYVKHEDYRAVAQDCAAFWKEKQQVTYQFVAPDQQSGGSEYEFYPAHNGYVRIMGTLDWKDPMFESTAKHLSEKYSTTVVDEKDVDASGEFVFGIYDSGSNVFHARLTVGPKDEEKTTVENMEWARAHGYTPGKHGTKEFNQFDANQLTKSLGMKFWDESPQELTNYLVLARRQ